MARVVAVSVILFAALALAGGVPLRARLKGADGSQCRSIKGVCGKKASCKTSGGSQVVSGLCPGSDVCCVPPVTIIPDFQGVVSIADKSKCQQTLFDGSRPPRAFLRGLALSFAKAVCEPTRPDVVFAGHASLQTCPNLKKCKGCATCIDTLSSYGDIMKKAIGTAPKEGLETVRQFYTLMVGLGMHESNGKYCTGRDGSMNFVEDTSAEAGLFQTSYGNIVAKRGDPLLQNLYDKYTKSSAGCLNDIYKEAITCRPGNEKNWGKAGKEGLKWQQLTKTCPGFATEYAATLLRLNRDEWGPIKKKAAEVKKDCYLMFGEVETFVNAHKNICNSIIKG
jgi:hypothetical protein